MRISYTVTPADDREALRTYYSALVPMAWFSGVATPFALTALGLGIYAYLTHNRPLAISFFACCAFILLKISLPQFLRTHFASSSRLTRQVEVDIGEYGIVSAAADDKTNSSWDEFRKYCESPNQFLLLYARRSLFIVPKRSLSGEQIAELRRILSDKLSQTVVRTGVPALRHAASLTILGIMGFFFFGGTIQRGIFWVVQPLFRRFAPSRPRRVRSLIPARPGQLHGEGKVFLVPFGDASKLLTTQLLDYYRQKYGIVLHLEPSIPIPEWARDRPQRQLVADELSEAMKEAYPDLARDPKNILVGVTDEDMYISGLDWKFALNYRAPLGGAVISTARLDPVFYGQSAAPDLMAARLRKLLTKNIGLTYYHMELSGDPASILYDDVETMKTLDGMSDEYSVQDAATGGEPELYSDYPWLSVRHYSSAEKQRKDFVFFDAGSSTHGETDLEVVNLDLRDQLVLSRRTDFYLPGELPLELSRVIRTEDGRSRAFGIGGSHSLNVAPVGNQWPFTWIDLIFEDGGRLHYDRVNWGASYWDAIYRVRPTTTDFYSSSFTWNWPGWKLHRQDGRIYYFPDGANVHRLEQAALIGVSDGQGNTLRLHRTPSGDLTTATANDGRWIHLQYDGQNRIIAGQDSAGGKMEYRYSPSGYLAEVEDRDHHVTQYAYDNSQRLSGMSVDGRQIWSVEFDGAGRIALFNLTDQGPYRFTYVVDGQRRVKEIDVTEPAQDTVHMVFDGRRYEIDPSPVSMR
jgi:YD repeat-containing protein